jgi:hypothetical protein
MDGGILTRHFDGPSLVAIMRDIACTIAGLLGWVIQIPKESPNLTVLALCMVCLGVPGISGGAILRRFFMDLPVSQSQSDSYSSSRRMD